MTDLVIRDNELESADRGQTKLSEAYIHLKPFKPEGISELKQYLSLTAYNIAKEVYPGIEPNINVELEEGSLKTCIVIAGTLFTLISNYGNFRSGINYLVNDARKAAEIINSTVVQKVNVKPEQIYRAERRLGVPGQLQKVLKEIDYLNNNVSHMKDSEISQVLTSISIRLRRMAANIDSENDMEFIIENLTKDVSFVNLPQENRNILLTEIDRSLCMHCAPQKTAKRTITKTNIKGENIHQVRLNR